MSISSNHPMNCPLRLARNDDIPALEELINHSVRILQAPFYSPAQLEAAIGPVFGVDAQLIRDGTYFVLEESGALVGCGGWSYRQAVFGGDRGSVCAEEALVPGKDPARIRAFFVHPDYARRGIGRMILRTCEAAIVDAGFEQAVLVATLTGEPLYASCGYAVDQRYEVSLGNDLSLPVVAMSERLVDTSS